MLEVLLAPRLYAVISGHGIGILPEVEMKAVPGRPWKVAFRHVETEGQPGGFHPASAEFEHTLIMPGLAAIGHLYAYPDRLRSAGNYIERLLVADAVGHSQRIPLFLVFPPSALIVLFSEDISRDICQEMCFGEFEPADFSPESAYCRIAVQARDDACAFSAPERMADFRGPGYCRGCAVAGCRG